jgi:6-phosphogluconate dehydrogenase
MPAAQKVPANGGASNAIDLGVPLTLIAEAVRCRFLCALKKARERAAGILSALAAVPAGGTVLVEAAHAALYCSKMVADAQGSMLLGAAAWTCGWQLAFGDIALVWRGSCIIRSRFLDDIKAAYQRDTVLDSQLVDCLLADEFARHADGWRRTVDFGITRGTPLPAFTAALSLCDGYRCARLPANLLQAQRDYFGAHTWQRLDAPLDRLFHFDWTGSRGEQLIDD